MYEMAKLLKSSKVIASHRCDPTSGHLKVSVAGLGGWITFRKKEELINFAHGFEDLQKQLRSSINKPF